MTNQTPFKIAIVGLGYVGLPLAQLFVQKGHTVYGIDVDAGKIASLSQGMSYLSDLDDEEVQALLATGRFFASTDFQSAASADAVILCVPTPLDNAHRPDLSYVLNAARQTLPYLRPGQLVTLESSTYPGTTEEELLPLLQSSGLVVGTDLALAYSPERISPGERRFSLAQIPKVIGGVTPSCTAFAERVYGAVFDQVVLVSSPRAAEMTKVVENAQRYVNISFMNELAMLCDKLSIDLWEVVKTASTKPYGFTPYYPGPGAGGHCIPVDPLYLLWKAKASNAELRFVELAHHINQQMPRFVVKKVLAHLPAAKQRSEQKILAIGVTYKKDVNDMRESSAIPILEELIGLGCQVSFYDPYMEELQIGATKLMRSPLTEELLRQQDCALILTDHSGVAYDQIVTCAPLVIDTRNATAACRSLGRVIVL